MSGTTDRNWRSYYGANPDVSGYVNPPDPLAYDDLMKFSNCTYVRVVDQTVAAGRENCIDAVRGENYAWLGCVLADGAGVATVTLKGALTGWAFVDCVIGRAAGTTDLELGQYDNYWYPGRPPTCWGRLERCTSPAGTIRITCWDATPPQIIASQVTLRRIPKYIWFPYFWAKWAWRKLTTKA